MKRKWKLGDRLRYKEASEYVVIQTNSIKDYGTIGIRNVKFPESIGFGVPVDSDKIRFLRHAYPLELALNEN